MKHAIATSLAIISLKSLIGFIGDIQVQIIDWSFLLLFSAISVIGIYLCRRTLSRYNTHKMENLQNLFTMQELKYLLEIH